MTAGCSCLSVKYYNRTYLQSMTCIVRWLNGHNVIILEIVTVLLELHNHEKYLYFTPRSTINRNSIWVCTSSNKNAFVPSTDFYQSDLHTDE